MVTYVIEMTVPQIFCLMCSLASAKDCVAEVQCEALQLDLILNLLFIYFEVDLHCLSIKPQIRVTAQRLMVCVVTIT